MSTHYEERQLIAEGNKLIAKYMGHKILEGKEYADSVYWPEEERWQVTDETNNLYYRSSWNDLIPVLLKIIFDNNGEFRINHTTIQLTTFDLSSIKLIKTNHSGSMESDPQMLIWKCIVNYLQQKTDR